MDPIGGLSLACNVLDMVDRAVQYGKTIKEICDSANGLSAQHESLEGVTQSMATVTKDLQAVQGRILHSETDVRMQAVAEECSAVCLAIQEILTKCKPKKENSVFSATAARIRISLNKSDLDKFQGKLDASTKSLNSLVAAKTL